MLWRKLRFFFELHWIKVVVVLVLIGSVAWPAYLLGQLDQYQRLYIMTLISTTPASAILGAVAFVFLYQYFLFGGGGFTKMNKSSIKGAKVGIRWTDVVGMEEVKREAWEVVQLIKDRARLQKIGGNPIRGLLMIGPPGCGKTYLAKAIATEANAPFLSVSGAEFVEIFVGVGAGRVRRLFKQAHQLAAAQGVCIIFIVEIDAVGRKRVFSVFGGTEETNSTQNQLLAELDGLQSRQENIIIIGATNAPEDQLDEALRRPGRFDRTIYIDLPGLDDREKLFTYYLTKVKAAPDLNAPRLARRAVWKSPAEIENIVKEGALIAARDNRNEVTFKDLSEAFERVDLGLKNHRKMSEEERRATAYHEAGHLIVVYLIHPTDDVFKASIVSRRNTLGVVYHVPRADYFSSNRNKMLADIKASLGGFVAEKLKCEATTDGVGADFRRAMGLAHNMVWRLGMGTNGFIGDYELLAAAGQGDHLSDHVKQKLNEETHQILDLCRKEVEALLKREEPLLDRFASELIKKNELEYDEIDAIFAEYGKKPSSRVVPAV